MKGEKQKQSLESLRKYAVSQLDREEKELKQSLIRLREEREILAQIDGLQGNASTFTLLTIFVNQSSSKIIKVNQG